MKTAIEILRECPEEMAELAKMCQDVAQEQTYLNSDSEVGFRWRKIAYALDQIADPTTLFDMKAGDQ